MNNQEIYLFEPFCLSLASRELTLDGLVVPLGSRAFDLLVALVKRHGRMATKDELIAEVWNGISVEENNLSVQISALRKALGEQPGEARYLATVQRHGYRFIAEVACLPGERRGMFGSASRQPLHPPLPLPDKPSIAVLPFTNISGDPEQTYFAEGMAEEILTALARCSSLFVIARNSSFAYGDHSFDKQRIGHELGVRYVLEGSVRRSGNRLRVACQLIDAATGVHIWADRFAGEMSDIFELQDRITATVVGTIEPQMQLAEIASRRNRIATHPNAYDHLLRAQQHEYEFTLTGFDAALHHLRRAVTIDPDYAQAMAFAAYCYGWRRTQGWTEDVAAETAEGLRLMSQALEIARFDPAVLWMSAFATFQLGLDPRRALELAYQSVEANPNSAIGLSVAGRLEIYQGRYETGKQLVHRAHRLNPRDPRVWHSAQAMALACLGQSQFDEGVNWARQVLTQNPRHTGAMRVLAANLAHLGQISKAVETLGSNLDIEPDLTISKLRARRLFQHEPLWRTFSQGLRLAGMPE